MAPLKKSQPAFVWTDYRAWRPTILSLLADHIDCSVFAELKENPPDYFVSDNLDWLNQAIKKAKGIASPDIVDCLVGRFPDSFRFVRAFHGCRPLSIDSYQDQGLLPSNTKTLQDIARNLFKNKELLEKAIQGLKEDDARLSYEDHNEGKVFFCLTLEYLIEHCGHYLLNGSEYLLAVAVQIGEQQVLRQQGKATAIECNVPTLRIPENYRRDLAGEILREICERACDPSYTPECLHFGFPILCQLEPSCIVAFHYPKDIPNPHNHQIREN